jgi:hypothetical protein
MLFDESVEMNARSFMVILKVWMQTKGNVIS